MSNWEKSTLGASSQSKMYTVLEVQMTCRSVYIVSHTLYSFMYEDKCQICNLVLSVIQQR